MMNNNEQIEEAIETLKRVVELLRESKSHEESCEKQGIPVIFTKSEYEYICNVFGIKSFTGDFLTKKITYMKMSLETEQLLRKDESKLLEMERELRNKIIETEVKRKFDYQELINRTNK